MNRIPARHLADRGRCGACKAPLEPVDTPLEVGAAEFDTIIADSRVPILVDFWAPWCGPCRMAKPYMDQLARESAGTALVLKVNTDEHPDLAARHGVSALPTFVAFRGGKAVDRQAGLGSPAQLRRLLHG